MQKITRRPSVLGNLIQSGPVLRETMARGNVALLRSLLGPAYRGLILQTAKGNDSTEMGLVYDAHFDWSYDRAFPEMSNLYEAAKAGQWNATTDIDWSIDVDPQNSARQLLPDTYMPPSKLPTP